MSKLSKYLYEADRAYGSESMLHLNMIGAHEFKKSGSSLFGTSLLVLVPVMVFGFVNLSLLIQ